MPTRLYSSAKRKPAKRVSKSESKDSDESDDDEMGVFAAAANENGPSSVFATSYHSPVMWKECVEALLSVEKFSVDATDDPRSRSNRIFVDGTLGGGGHSQALLESLTAGDIVFGCDVDPDALSTASERLSSYCDISKSSSSPIFIPVQSNFADLRPELLCQSFLSTLMNTGSNDVFSHLQQHCEKDKSLLVDGILLDLGVSSYQIDTAERGFAFMKDGPLDMRMTGNKNVNNGTHTSSRTAADLCNELDFPELRRIFQVYADEPRSKAIAYSIMDRRPLRTTGDLQQAVAAVTPEFAKRRRLGRTATLARIFQSLRIVVNREDVALDNALTKMAPSLLRPGGRLAVLSYHSMEDRATKRVMRDGTRSKREAERMNKQRDVFGNYIGEPKPFKTLGKPLKASDKEIKLNSRARSATLRVAEKI